jgi:hypothetical protein
LYVQVAPPLLFYMETAEGYHASQKKKATKSLSVACESCWTIVKRVSPASKHLLDNQYHTISEHIHIISCHIDFRTKDYANAAVSQWKVKDVMTDADKGEAEIGGSEGGAHLLLFPELVCHGGHQLI